MPGVEESQISALMIPEGGHNRQKDSTYFILKRKKYKDVKLDAHPLTVPKQAMQVLLEDSQFEAIQKMQNT